MSEVQTTVGTPWASKTLSTDNQNGYPSMLRCNPGDWLSISHCRAYFSSYPPMFGRQYAS